MSTGDQGTNQCDSTVQDPTVSSHSSSLPPVSSYVSSYVASSLFPYLLYLLSLHCFPFPFYLPIRSLLLLYYFHIPFSLLPPFLFLPSDITIPLPSHSLPSICPLLFYVLTFLPSLSSSPPYPSLLTLLPFISLSQALLTLIHGSPRLQQQ